LEKKKKAHKALFSNREKRVKGRGGITHWGSCLGTEMRTPQKRGKRKTSWVRDCLGPLHCHGNKEEKKKRNSRPRERGQSLSKKFLHEKYVPRNRVKNGKF